MEDKTVILDLKVAQLATQHEALSVRVDRELTNIAAKTVSKEVHTVEYKAIDRRMSGFEATLNKIVWMLITNLMALSGFFIWQYVA